MRLVLAWRYFLDPDEALHYLLASHETVRTTYAAALTQAHPPLLILLLHFWRVLGHSELMLRMPSILAGTGCCWLTYLWLRRITNRSTAFIGLLLVTFAPALIETSIEVRQYAPLLLFISAGLYFSERALQENSVLCMNLFSLSLFGALLVHYSGLLYAVSMGVYVLVRLYPYGKNLRLFAAWGAGQVLGIAISSYFLLTHIPAVRQSGIVRSDFATHLHKSILGSSGHGVLTFIPLQTLRVFTYLFSHGLLGTLALVTFAAGLYLLLRGKSRNEKQGPADLELALLLGLPFVLNCAAAIAGEYPYGGTRHTAVLAIFALTGVSFGIAALKIGRAWMAPAVVLLALAVCNIFPSPPPLIRARDHERSHVQSAVQYLRQSAQPGSVILADYESGLLLGYYFCGHGVVQDLPPYQPFSKVACGPYSVVAPFPGEWKFYGRDFEQRAKAAAQAQGLAPGSKVWLFYGGWIVDSTPDMRNSLRRMGCADPQLFGQNFLLCEVSLSGDGGQ